MRRWRWPALAQKPACPRTRAFAPTREWQRRLLRETESKITKNFDNALVSLLGDERSGSFGAAAVHQQISRRYDENRENDGSEQAADDHARERCVGFAPRFQLECHGQQADDGGERRH